MSADGGLLADLETYVAAQAEENASLKKQVAELLHQHESDQQLLDRLHIELARCGELYAAAQRTMKMSEARWTAETDSLQMQLLEEREARMLSEPPPPIVIIPVNPQRVELQPTSLSPRRPLSLLEDSSRPSDLSSVVGALEREHDRKLLALEEALARVTTEVSMSEDFAHILSLWIRADVPSLQRDAAIASLVDEQSVAAETPSVRRADSMLVGQLRLSHEEQLMELRQKLAEATRRSGYLEYALEEAQSRVCRLSAGDGQSRSLPCVSQSSQTATVERLHVATSCYLSVPELSLQHQALSSRSSNEPTFHPSGQYEEAIFQLQQDKAKLESTVEALRGRNEQLTIERRDLQIKSQEKVAAAERRATDLVEQLNKKLLESSSTLARYRIFQLNEKGYHELNDYEGPSSSCDRCSETSVEIERMKLAARQSTVEIKRLGAVCDEQMSTMSLLKERIGILEEKHERLQETALSLQARLREKAVEADSLRQQLKRQTQHELQRESERSESESALRSQIVSLSSKLRATQEGQLVSQYKAERNVVSVSAFEDLQLQLSEQQQQLSETRQLLLELVGDLCPSTISGSANRMDDGMASPVQLCGTQNVFAASVCFSAPSPIAEKPLGVSVVELAKRALLRERSQSLTTPVAKK